MQSGGKSSGKKGKGGKKRKKKKKKLFNRNGRDYENEEGSNEEEDELDEGRKRLAETLAEATNKMKVEAKESAEKKNRLFHAPKSRVSIMCGEL